MRAGRSIRAGWMATCAIIMPLLVTLFVLCPVPSSAVGHESGVGRFIEADLSSQQTEKMDRMAEKLEEQAAKLLARAEAQAHVERQEAEQRQALLETHDSEGSPVDASRVSSSSSPVPALSSSSEPEDERMFQIFSEDQFPEDHTDEHIAMLDENNSVEARLDRHLKAKIEAMMLRNDPTAVTIKQEHVPAVGMQQQAPVSEKPASNSVLLQTSVSSNANSANEATTSSASMSELDAEIQAEIEAEQQRQEELDAASVLEDAFVQQEYPVMIESASTAKSETKNLPDKVKNVIGSIMHSARERIAAAVKKTTANNSKLAQLRRAVRKAVQHSKAKTPSNALLENRANLHARSKAGGGQWWLQKAPWFLPPPPEWGPMPVTMYTSYYHRPTGVPQQMDYAQGIPLPSAEALNVARREYPHPPFDMAMMETASETHTEEGAEAETEAENAETAHADVDAETEAENESEVDADTEADSESEDEGDVAETAMLELGTALDGDYGFVEYVDDVHAVEAATAAQTQPGPASAPELNHDTTFILTDDAQRLSGSAHEAVEAEEVDDLARASPLSGEVYYTARI